MSLPPDQDPSGVLARIMAARRSVRSFSEAIPVRRDVERITAAGLAAPYAAAMSAGGALDRRFFVLPSAGAALGAAARAIQTHAQQALAAPATPTPLRARLEPVAEGRILGVGTAPCYVVVAERQGQTYQQPPQVTWSDHGARFVAAVENGPLSATQFHPEKSGDAGAHLLENWVATLG